MERRDIIKIVCVVLTLSTTAWGFVMEDSCVFTGLLDVAEGAKVEVNGGGLTVPRPIPSPCQMIFRAAKEDHILTIEVKTNRFIDCSVQLHIITTTTQTLKCGESNPGTIHLDKRIVTLDLVKNNDATDYRFQLIITANKKIIDPGVQDTQPVAVGLVIGIVGGVFILLIIMAIAGTCCYRRAKRYKHEHPQGFYDAGDDYKRKLEEREPSHVSVGFTNSSASVEHESSPGAKRKLLNENNYTTANYRPKTLGLKNQDKNSVPPPNIEKFVGSPKKSTGDFDFGDEDPYDKLDDKVENSRTKPQPQKSPLLDALHKNRKFKSTFNATEKEAEERRQRMSSSSLSQGVTASDASLDSATTPPKLPAVPPIPKSPGSKHKHASIKGRVPRPVSSSEEEIGQKARTSDESDESIKESNTRSKPSRVEEIPVSSGKQDTRHTLKPDRGKSSKDKGRQFEKSNSKDRKLSELPDAVQRIGNFEKNASIRSSRSSKRSNKSPRLGAKNRGFAHRRNRGDDTDSRPGTPTSMMDDLESLPPLERSGSKQSLYASRSSLYRRRGRSRNNSFTDSIASTNYAHDDMEVCRHSHTYSRNRYDHSGEEFDGYERPVNRSERHKMFKSEGDIFYDSKSKSTQTLRETATQTGQEESVVSHSPRIMRKKRRSKSLSAAGTQTTVSGKETKTKDSKTRSKSTASDKPKTKPKPKPKPRKSTEGELNENKNVRSSAENLADKNEEDRGTANENGVSYPDGGVSPPLPPPPPQGVPVYPDSLPPGMSQPPYMQYGMQPSAIPPHMMQPGMVAYNAVPPGGTLPYNMSQGMPPPPPYPQTLAVTQPSNQPKKSKWDLLCEMTNKQNNAAPSETGSVSNSVFMSNPPSQMGDPNIVQPSYGDPNIVQPPYGDPNIVQPPYISYYQPQSAQMLPMTINPSIGVPSGPPSLGGGSHGHRSGPPSVTGSDPGVSPQQNGPVHEQPTMLAKKSSWEALRDITDNQYKLAYGTTSESMI